MKPKHEPYEVGYKKPPKHSQFQKGVSGNPKGRRKGVLNQATIFRNALLQRISVTVDGRVRTMTMIEAVVLRMTNGALKGDAKAVQMVLSLAPWIDAVPLSNLDSSSETDEAVMKDIMERLLGQ